MARQSRVSRVPLARTTACGLGTRGGASSSLPMLLTLPMQLDFKAFGAFSSTLPNLVSTSSPIIAPPGGARLHQTAHQIRHRVY